MREVYRQLYFEDTAQKGLRGRKLWPQVRRGSSSTSERDHWRELVDKNPLLKDKIVGSTMFRADRAPFMRSAQQSVRQWEAVFGHYDKDSSGGLDLSNSLTRCAVALFVAIVGLVRQFAAVWRFQGAALTTGVHVCTSMSRCALMRRLMI